MCPHNNAESHVNTINQIRNTDDIPTGIIYDVSETRMGEVSDGTTNTYLIGEKFVYSDKYEDSYAHGDGFVMYAGVYNMDINSNFRAAGAYGLNKPKLIDGTITYDGHAYPTMQDCSYETGKSLKFPPHLGFGSPHSGSFGMTMADASVQHISYSIDPAIHACLANRKDSMPAQVPQ